MCAKSLSCLLRLTQNLLECQSWLDRLAALCYSCAMSINRKESGDDLDNLGVAIEKALHVVAAEEIMGLQEKRTLSEILGEKKLSPQEKMALAFYASYTVQEGFQDYLTKNQVVLRQLFNRDLQTQKGIEAIFNTQGGRFLKRMELLEQLSGSLKQACKPLIYRILEQQQKFFQQTIQTPDAVMLFTVAFGLTAYETTINTNSTEMMRQFYQSRHDVIPQEEAKEVLEFCNELRVALGLKPLE